MFLEEILRRKLLTMVEIPGGPGWPGGPCGPYGQGSQGMVRALAENPGWRGCRRQQEHPYTALALLSS